jgi:peptidoglycan/xylan/chitin deacetylase (PgdA/CDA1 family)
VFSLSGTIRNSAIAISKPAVLPRGNGVVLPNSDFTALYDLSGVPAIPISLPSQSTGPVLCVGIDSSFCSWGCGFCERPTDVITCQNHQQWAVTYDDGPSEFTDQLLDTLEQTRAKATFFVTGSQVQLHPEVLARAYRLGHQIASHTWSHRALTSLSTEVIVAELEWTSIAIENVIGVRPKYFRPPFGDIDDRVRAIADAMNLIPVIWSFDSRDFEIPLDLGPRVDQAAQQWRQASSGIISLQHDLYAHQLALAQPVLDRVLAAGMNVVTVAACIGDNNPYLNQPAPVSRAPIAVTRSPIPATRTFSAPPSRVTVAISTAPNTNTTSPSTHNKKNNNAIVSKPFYLLLFVLYI